VGRAQAASPDLSGKIQQVAAELEKSGLAKAGFAGSGIGALLDRFA